MTEDELTDLETLHYSVNEGDCVGDTKVPVENEEVDGPRMAMLLIEQRSDPSFFQLTEDGEDEEGFFQEEDEDP